MAMVKKIQDKLKRHVYKYLYQREARQILSTQPVKEGSLPYILLSMVHHRDVASYLVAAKSFIRQAAPRKVVVVCDPSIDADDRTKIRRHIPNVELRDADEFTHDAIPRGGTWERLFAIANYANSSYVVQLDADTITVGPIDEVSSAIESNCGFVIGERAHQKIESLAEVSRRAKVWVSPSVGSQHIQAVVEAAIEDVGLPAGEVYVRGCSGFTGFPVDPGMKARMLAFSALMHQWHGQRWTEWGTEQITSNYLIANAAGTTVLPFPKYGTPDELGENTAFLHFIGYLRFINRKYEKMTKALIAQLEH